MTTTRATVVDAEDSLSLEMDAVRKDAVAILSAAPKLQLHLLQLPSPQLRARGRNVLSARAKWGKTVGLRPRVIGLKRE